MTGAIEAVAAAAGGLDSLDARLAEQPQGDLGKVEHAFGGDSLAEAGESAEDLLADLVAAGADAGADRSVGRPDGLDASGDDARRQPAPAAVEHRDTAGAGEGDREAVGDEDERSQARFGGGVAVDVGDRAAGIGEGTRRLRPGVDGELGPVDLVSDRDRTRLGADRGGEPPAVLDHRGSESSVRMPRLRLAKSPSLTPPRRVENTARAPGMLGLEESQPTGFAPVHPAALAVSSATASSCSRPEISPSIFLRFASARPRPTARPCSTPAAIRSLPPISSSTLLQLSR